MNSIAERLRSLADAGYKAFQSSLIPTVPKDRFIGVRTPQLRSLAREMLADGSAQDFLSQPLPHSTFDEMQLHAFMINSMKDFGKAMSETERLLPHIDNWATCDQLSPAVFRKDHVRLMAAIDRWMSDGNENTQTEPCLTAREGLSSEQAGAYKGETRQYTVRFAIKMLMQHYLDAPHFSPECLEKVAAVRREEYYIRMMQAWYFATALAKQYDAALPYIKARRLDEWTHRKAIQKARESRRLTKEQKDTLKSLI